MNTKRAPGAGSRGAIGPSTTHVPPRPRVTEPLGPLDVLRIAAETLCSERTVRRWLIGEPVYASNHFRLAHACAKFGIAVIP
jgi:hypothetical protein